LFSEKNKKAQFANTERVFGETRKFVTVALAEIARDGKRFLNSREETIERC
jgi:hypothetical protein